MNRGTEAERLFVHRRREHRQRIAAGWMLGEVDWRLPRGDLQGYVIDAVEIAANGQNIYYRLRHKETGQIYMRVSP